jgi:putative transposase
MGQQLKQITKALAQAEPDENAVTGPKKRKVAALVAVMRYVRKLRVALGGDSLDPAIDIFSRQFADGLLPGAVVSALTVLRPKKVDCPHRATLYRWDEKYAKHLQGREAEAAPQHQGRKRKDYGWELRALALYHIPSKPTSGAVAEQLRDEGFDSATNDRVRRFLQTMPATLGPQSPHRVGKHYHDLNRGRYVRRNTDCLDVGEVYTMDGHTVDVYLAHPISGGIWRPELTVVECVKSRFIPGWYLSEAESTHSSMLALSHAMLGHDHVPAWMHVDNGSGFKAKAMSDEAVGFYARFSIQPMFSIPGNSKGRGHIERLFRTIRDKHDKLFMGGMFYCGDDMAPEINRRLHDQLKQGKRALPTLAQYRDSLARFLERYCNTKHSAHGRTPADVWDELERVPLEVPADATVRERTTRTIRRAAIELHKRVYSHTDLALYNDRVLPVEYSIHDDAHVYVYDEQDRLVCVAELVTKADYLPASRLEEQRQRRKEGQLKRLQKKVAEVEAQHGNAITHDQQMEQIAALLEPARPAPALEQAEGETLDLLSPLLRGRAKEKGDSPLRLSPLDIDGE